MSGTNAPRPYRRLSQQEFLKRVEESGTTCKPLDEYTRMSDNIRWQCNDYDDHIWYATPSNILKSKNATGCPYCAGQKVLKGFNDLWTTHPDIAKCLRDKNFGYEVSSGSRRKADFVCPQCGASINNITVKDAVRYNLSCPCCGDGISFPERFISNMLNQFEIDYVHDKSLSWSNNKRYDFYIEKYNLIIETHGEQHYDENKQWDGDTIDIERLNDEDKFNMAISNGIEFYIVLDCRKSDGDYIKNSILNSNLNKLFDLSNVDWDKCETDSYKSSVVKACDLWNNGIHSTKEIANILHLNRVTVINYLNKGTKYGICNYNGKEQMKLSADKNRPKKKAA